VLRAEGDTRTSRLAMCDLTARVLAHGLNLLGIAAPDRM
jgi:arginyl-tRNA synthetase